MDWSQRLKHVFSPPATVSQKDSGLTFTDILFGFVISELFIRLQNWAELATTSRWQLIAATVLVLGSWLGFRRSLTRSTYEVKFFNLPFSRFVLDQIMVILYFRVATLIPRNAASDVDVAMVAHQTIKTVAFIFVLYLVWDLLGMLMTIGTKYPRIVNGEADVTQPNPPELRGLAITLLFMTLAYSLLLAEGRYDWDPTALLAGEVALLLLYRWAKEIRTSWTLATRNAAA